MQVGKVTLEKTHPNAFAGWNISNSLCFSFLEKDITEQTLAKVNFCTIFLSLTSNLEQKQSAL